MINNMTYHKKAWQAFLKRHDIILTEEEFKQKISGKKNGQILELIFGKKFDKEVSKTTRKRRRDSTANYLSWI